MQYHACIPQGALFPTFDSWWVGLFESRGIDMTCGEYGILLNLAICGILAALMCAAFIGAAIIGARRDARRYRRKYRLH